MYLFMHTYESHLIAPTLMSLRYYGMRYVCYWTMQYSLKCLSAREIVIAPEQDG